MTLRTRAGRARQKLIVWERARESL